MSPLDALTLQRLRSLEIVVSWLIGQSLSGEPDPNFAFASMDPTYILELAERIQEELEDEDA